MTNKDFGRWFNLLNIVVGGLLVLIIWEVFKWLGPQINPQLDISINLTLLSQLILGLYIFLSLGPIKENIEPMEILKSNILIRVVGGIFWLCFGLLLIENQLSGKVDPSTSPYLNYSLASMAIIVGGLQVIGRYELAKTALKSIIYGESYQLENKWKHTVQKTSTEMDEEYKKELIKKASNKIKKLKKEGAITNSDYEKLLKIVKKTEKMDYDKFSRKYLENGTILNK